MKIILAIALLSLVFAQNTVQNCDDNPLVDYICDQCAATHPIKTGSGTSEDPHVCSEGTPIEGCETYLDSKATGCQKCLDTHLIVDDNTCELGTGVSNCKVHAKGDLTLCVECADAYYKQKGVSSDDKPTCESGVGIVDCDLHVSDLVCFYCKGNLGYKAGIDAESAGSCDVLAENVIDGCWIHNNADVAICDQCQAGRVLEENKCIKEDNSAGGLLKCSFGLVLGLVLAFI